MEKKSCTCSSSFFSPRGEHLSSEGGLVLQYGRNKNGYSEKKKVFPAKVWKYLFMGGNKTKTVDKIEDFKTKPNLAKVIVFICHPYC